MKGGGGRGGNLQEPVYSLDIPIHTNPLSERMDKCLLSVVCVCIPEVVSVHYGWFAPGHLPQGHHVVGRKAGGGGADAVHSNHPRQNTVYAEHPVHADHTVHYTVYAGHPVQYTVYAEHPVQYTVYADHPVQYTVYAEHPVQYAVYADHPVQFTVYADHPVQNTVYAGHPV